MSDETPSSAVAALAELPPDQRALLAALAALPDVGLTAAQAGDAVSAAGDAVSAAGAGGPAAGAGVAAALADLERRGLAHETGVEEEPVLRADAAAAAMLAGDPAVAAARERLVTRSLAWAGAGSGPGSGTAPTELDLHVAVLGELAGQERWPDAADLALTLAPALIACGRWDAARTTLSVLRRSARRAGRPGVEAYALHELGTLALCEGDPRAPGLLADALELRSRLGDAEAAALTRHNLDLLAPRSTTADEPKAATTTRAHIPPRPAPPPTPAAERVPAPQRASLQPPPPPSRPAATARWRSPYLVLPLVALLLVAAAAVLARTLTGGPRPTLSATTLDLGSVALGTEARREVVLANAGGRTMTIATATLSGPAAADYAVDAATCRRPLGAGESCRLVVRLVPSAVGERRAQLRVSVGGEVLSVGLTGTGVAAQAGRPVVEPRSAEFGTATVGGLGPVRTIRLRNAGDGGIALGRPVATGDYAVRRTTCAAALPPRAQCVVAVRFVAARPGLRTGRLVVPLDDGAVAVPLSGRGVLAPVAAPVLDPARFAFPGVPVGAERVATAVLRNRSDLPLRVGTPRLEGRNTGAFAAAARCGTVPVRGRCDLVVTFAPRSTGDLLATVVVSVGDAVLALPVSGRGVDTTPPVLRATGLAAEAASAAGAVVRYRVDADDAVDGEVTAVCTPPPGATFPLGRTQVSCTATDRAGNVAGASYDVVVRDTTPPAFGAPLADQVVPATQPDGAVVTWPPPEASDLVDGTVATVCTPASGSVFTLGDTVVICAAEDSRGNRAEETFTVSVRGGVEGPAGSAD